MKNLLIIYPHWPPSNLAGVHRPRLISNFVSEFGWHPIVLTVLPGYYEEVPDQDIAKTVADNVEVIYTKAFKLTTPRLIGDIGLRAFTFLYKEALKLIRERQIDFVWIPIPSFYTALMGRILHERTSVPYGIDYIDPWIRDIHNRKNWRSKLSLQIAKILEPIAVKKASLLSGVSEAYYKPVRDRNFKNKEIEHIGMPYGFDPHDHEIVVDNILFPWSDIPDCHPLVYAGAFLPNSHLFIKAMFSAVSKMVKNGAWDSRKHFYFLGTGFYDGKSIADYAKEYGIQYLVHEFRERFPFLHVLNYLSAAYAVMTIGSTEKHYTASKIFQALLSKKPVLAVFHEESSAVCLLKECKALRFLVEYNPSISFSELEGEFTKRLQFLFENKVVWEPDLSNLEQYSSKNSAKLLIMHIELALKDQGS
ncbi:glycosyltransferase family 4 protein [Pontibacter sp. SGAir0037]|uniref:glycosyltransferase family 4 protein n=1 Tax=Pontibacter sp. SGAir0037 TaxID=2571030 RepID=UPI0010CCE282|nr:glycosyltransferase family 4 protein [Pontibacter sp. SGAir0037]QCR22165.1 hypothetical protein C1N53_07305 [Pontibacter sp. SGAir0037]